MRTNPSILRILLAALLGVIVISITSLFTHRDLVSATQAHDAAKLNGLIAAQAPFPLTDLYDGAWDSVAVLGEADFYDPDDGTQRFSLSQLVKHPAQAADMQPAGLDYGRISRDYSAAIVFYQQNKVAKIIPLFADNMRVNGIDYDIEVGAACARTSRVAIVPVQPIENIAADVQAQPMVSAVFCEDVTANGEPADE